MLDATAARNARRREYIQRDREILALQNNLREDSIMVHEFLMAAAHNFEPLEQEYEEIEVEMVNHPQNEISAVEALLVAVAVRQRTRSPAFSSSSRHTKRSRTSPSSSRHTTASRTSTSSSRHTTTSRTSSSSSCRTR